MTNFGHLHHPHHNISRARWQHMIPSIFSGRHYLLGPVASLGGSFWDEKIHRPCLNLSRYSRYNSGSFRHLIPHHTPDRIGYSVIDHLVKSTFKYVEFMQLSCKLHQIALHLWASWNLGKKTRRLRCSCFAILSARLIAVLAELAAHHWGYLMGLITYVTTRYILFQHTII